MRSEGPVALLGVYPSRANPAKEHVVQMGEDENVYCSCPAWRFQKGTHPRERTCKHIERWKTGDRGLMS